MTNNNEIFDFAAKNKVTIECYSDRYGRSVRAGYTDSEGVEYGHVVLLGPRTFGVAVEEVVQTLMSDAASRGPWLDSRPPNEVVVEVELDGKIIEVLAYFGRDGSRPHWRTADGGTCWSVDTFTRWRHKA